MTNKDTTSNVLIEPISSLPTGGTEELDRILKDLHSTCLDAQLSMIATQDGLTMASLGTVIDPDQVGAMCTELQAVCKKTARELEQGILEQMLLKCSDGYLLLSTAGDHAILAVMTKPGANLGMVFLESQRAAKAIQFSLHE